MSTSLPLTITRQISEYLLTGMHHSTVEGQQAIADIIAKNLSLSDTSFQPDEIAVNIARWAYGYYNGDGSGTNSALIYWDGVGKSLSGPKFTIEMVRKHLEPLLNHLAECKHKLESALETVQEMDRVHNDIMENGPRCTCGDGDEWCRGCSKSEKLSRLANRTVEEIERLFLLSGRESPANIERIMKLVNKQAVLLAEQEAFIAYVQKFGDYKKAYDNSRKVS